MTTEIIVFATMAAAGLVLLGYGIGTRRKR